MMSRAAFVFLALFVAQAASKEIIVGGSAGWIETTFEPITAEVGDVLVFNFVTGAHDVYLMSEDTCDFSAGEELSDAGPYKYELTEAGEFIFACSINDHCDEGQKVVVTVKEAAGAAAPGPAPGAGGIVTTTIGDVVAGLCKPIKDALAGADLTAVSGALAVLAKTEIDVPAGADLVIAAPVNAAFGKAVAALGITTQQLLGNTGVLAQILSDHVSADVDGVLSSLAGNKVTIDEAAKLITVAGAAAPVPIAAGPIVCEGPNGKQTAFVISEVVVPGELVPKGPVAAPAPAPVAKAPAPAPVAKAPAPTTAAPAPVSGASTLSVVLAAFVAMVAALM